MLTDSFGFSYALRKLYRTTEIVAFERRVLGYPFKLVCFKLRVHTAKSVYFTSRFPGQQSYLRPRRNFFFFSM